MPRVSTVVAGRCERELATACACSRPTCVDTGGRPSVAPTTGASSAPMSRPSLTLSISPTSSPPGIRWAATPSCRRPGAGRTASASCCSSTRSSWTLINTPTGTRGLRPPPPPSIPSRGGGTNGHRSMPCSSGSPTASRSASGGAMCCRTTAVTAWSATATASSSLARRWSRRRSTWAVRDATSRLRIIAAVATYCRAAATGGVGRRSGLTQSPIWPGFQPARSALPNGRDVTCRPHPLHPDAGPTWSRPTSGVL